MKKLASVFLLFALCATLILPARAEEYGAVTLSGTNTTYAESQVTVVFDQAKVSTEQLTIGIVGDEDGVFDEVIVVDEAHVILVRPDSKVTITDSRGNSTTHQSPLYSVSEPGRYRISVQDNAGNTSSKTFTVRGELNPATPIAILIIIALAAAGVIFYLRTRTNTNVR